MTADGTTLELTRDSRFTQLSRLALLASVATPLILVPSVFFPFVTTRNIFFRLCVELAFALVLLGGVRRLRDIDVKSDRVLPWFFAYLVALSLAAVAGLSPWHSVFGDFERMGGVFAWLHLFIFYCLLRAVMEERHWQRLFTLIVLAADLAVVWGALEFLPASIRNPLFQTTLVSGSTTGNPGLLGPFLVLSGGVACLGALSAPKRPWRIFFAASLALLAFGLAASRNRSSELGVIFGALTAVFLHILTSRHRGRVVRKYAVGLLGVVAVLAIAAIFIRRDPVLTDRFVGRWVGFLDSPIDYSRTIEWKIALAGFIDRPLLGYGPENHQIVASHHFDPRIYAILSDGVFDRTHNAWLELLATSGIAGFLTMVGLWVTAVMEIRRGVRVGSLRASEAAIIIGALVGYAVFLTFWFFDINAAFIWVALLAFISSRVRGRLFVTDFEVAMGKMHPLAWAIVLLTALTAYLQGIVPLRVARQLSLAVGSGPFEDRLIAFGKAMDSSAPQTEHTFPLYTRFLRTVAPEMTTFGTNAVRRKEFDLALRRGAIEAERSIARNPEDDRSYVDAARFYSLAALVYSDTKYLLMARSDLRRGARISPRRPDIRLLLSGINLSLRDTVSASAQLDSAMKLSPEYLIAFVVAAKFNLGLRRPDSSAKLLLRAMAPGPPVPGVGKIPVEHVLGPLVDTLEARGMYARAAALEHTYLERALGPEATWARPGISAELSPFAKNVANMLPIHYLKAGDTVRATRAANALAAFEPRARAATTLFTRDLTAGTIAGWRAERFVFDTTKPSRQSSTVARH